MNKCAIITGATKGIGKAIALAICKEYHLILTHSSTMNDKQREALLNEFDTSNNIHIIQANVKDFEACSLLLDVIKDNEYAIEVLINNAGITKDNLLLKMTSDDFKEVIDVNLVGSFNMIKIVSKLMIKQKYGRIINMSSVIGQIGNIGQTNYAASKAGLFGLTKSLAKELASRNITVNCVAPGFIKTDMTDKLDELSIKNIQDKIPSKRLGEVDDVVNAILFLISSNSSYITGQIINVCGGMVM